MQERLVISEHCCTTIRICVCLELIVCYHYAAYYIKGERRSELSEVSLQLKMKEDEVNELSSQLKMKQREILNLNKINKRLMRQKIKRKVCDMQKLECNKELQPKYYVCVCK